MPFITLMMTMTTYHAKVLCIEFLYVYVSIEVLNVDGVKLLVGSGNVVWGWDWWSFAWRASKAVVDDEVSESAGSLVGVTLSMCWNVVVDYFKPVHEIPGQLLGVVEVTRTSGGVDDDDLVVVEESELVDAVSVDGVG